MKQRFITRNGTYAINSYHSAPASSVVLSGDFGGAIVTLTLGTIDGSIVDVTDSAGNPIVYADEVQEVVTHGAGNQIYAKVTGATGSTRINLSTYPIK